LIIGSIVNTIPWINISFIEDSQIIKKILKHLGLWAVKRRVPPRANSPPPGEFPDYDELPSPSTDAYLTDPQYPIETYL
jgi:hypothetical protein